MSNLYTHIERRFGERRISLLTKLKFAYRTTPKNYQLIKDLKRELAQLEKPKPKIDYRKKYGMFGWKAKQAK